MKLILKHSHHQPSPAFAALLRQQLAALGKDLRIDEARVFIEHRREASPPFRVAAHLVTPGPDVFAEAVDHTLRAALQKTIEGLEGRIGHRHQRRARRLQKPLRTAAPGPLTHAGGRP